MKKFKLNISDRGLKILILDIVALLVLVLGIVYIVSSCTSSAPAVNSSSIAPVSVPQPPSAQSVANAVHCGTFKDMGAATADQWQITVDSGTCWINCKKYAINTFTTSANRDAWLKVAEVVGVNPKWETDTAVVYPSTNPYTCADK